MSRVQQGGTRKYCPQCNEIRVCAAVNPASLGEGTGQRVYMESHEDLQWFRRGLVCQTCGNKWLTAELPESVLDELVELRNALKRVKTHAEQYIAESEQAAESLKNLSTSLYVLRALRIYREP